MESTISYMSYFISNTPSDITNEVFIKIPIYELLGSENTMVNEHINKHIMYYINNHFLSHNEIASYLINHRLYKEACNEKIIEISNMIATRFYEVSEGKYIIMLAPENEHKVISIVNFEASNTYNASGIYNSPDMTFSLSNFAYDKDKMMSSSYDKIITYANNIETVADKIADMIFAVVSVVVPSDIQYEISIKLLKRTYNGTSALLDSPSTAIIETILQIK